MIERNLKSLGKDYAGGKIDTKTYRDERKRLIDNITRPAVSNSGGEIPNIRKKLSASTFFILWFAGLAAAASILVIALKMGPESGNESKSAATVQSTPETMTTNLPPPTSDSIKFVREFLELQDWSAGALEIFHNKWTSMSAEERKGVVYSQAYPALRNAVAKRWSMEQTQARLNGKDYYNEILLKIASQIDVAVNLPEQRAVEPESDADQDATGEAIERPEPKMLTTAGKIKPAGGSEERPSAGAVANGAAVESGDGSAGDTSAGKNAEIVSAAEGVSGAEKEGSATSARENISDPGLKKETCDNSWLAVQDPEKYTLQICMLSDEQKVRHLLEDNRDLKLKAARFKDKGSVWIIYGVFDTYAQAEEHSEKITKKMRSSSNESDMIVKIFSLQSTKE